MTSLKSGLNYRPDAVHKYLRNTDILYSYEARNVPVWLVNKLMGFQVLIYKHLVQNNMQYMSTLLATYEKWESYRFLAKSFKTNAELAQGLA